MKSSLRVHFICILPNEWNINIIIYLYSYSDTKCVYVYLMFFHLQIFYCVVWEDFRNVDEKISVYEEICVEWQG